jgi:putative FmdB family regulatory protein
MRHTSAVPIYEYVCRDCAKSFEELTFEPASAPPCPSCQSAEVERVLSVVAVGSSEPAVAASPCGRCGDPRGPGACSMN